MEEVYRFLNSASEENAIQAYKSKVSKLNGWQLRKELTSKVEVFDRLCEDLEVAASVQNRPDIMKIENKREKVQREIEMLRSAMRPEAANP